MTGDNQAAIRIRHDGYIISESVRRVDEPFRDYVLDQEGYTCEYDKDGNLTFKYKSRLQPKKINVTNFEGKKVKENTNERIERLAKCRANPGELADTPNCINSEQAESLADTSKRGGLDVQPMTDIKLGR